jgi:hypothetical protein
MQHTPFMINTGRHHHMGFKPHQARSKLESVNEFTDRMAEGLEETKAALAKVKDKYVMYYNCRREPAPIFAPGDKVWLNGSNIVTNQPSSKLSRRRLGPFAIEACIGHRAYCLALPPQLRQLHPIFLVVKLSIATPDPIPGCRCAPPPPLTLIDGEEEFKVEAILNS